jgi:glucan biosynthesis protein C
MNPRLIFMDNLRYALVLCVVLQHSGNAYSSLSWWPVSEPESSLIADWLTAILDTFTMPFLFYIAGYFALPTLQKKGLHPDRLSGAAPCVSLCAERLEAD